MKFEGVFPFREKEAVMQSVQENIVVDLILQHRRELHFPDGLAGCGEARDFVLVAKDHEAPLFWLELKNMTDRAFLTVDPFLIYPEYSPEFYNNDLEELHVDHADDLFVLCIAHVKPGDPRKISLNLAEPLLINWATGIGKQVKIRNANEYAHMHSIGF